MYVRWKMRLLKTQGEGNLWAENHSAELFRSYRDEQGRTRQKYVATLGSYREESSPSGKDLTKEIYGRSRFWTSVWRTLHRLGVEGEERNKIAAALPFQGHPLCLWSPPGYSIGKWNDLLDRNGIFPLRPLD